MGLAAAAHLLELGVEPLVLEAGPDVGHTIRDWAHVRLFTAWESVVDAASLRLLQNSGWTMPPSKDFPNGGALVQDYLEPLGTALGDRVRFSTKVVALSRLHRDKVATQGRENVPFVVRAETADGVVEFLADSVIDAFGTWFNPNPVGASGLPALGEETISHTRCGMPDVLGGSRPAMQAKESWLSAPVTRRQLTS